LGLQIIKGDKKSTINSLARESILIFVSLYGVKKFSLDKMHKKQERKQFTLAKNRANYIKIFVQLALKHGLLA
jgi:hypothetical protein